MLIDGRALAKQIEQDLKKKIAASGIDAGLAAILIGSNPASETYVRLKQKAAERVGIRFETHTLPDTTNNDAVINLIEQLNARDDIHGILLQLPLPEQLATNRIIRAIDPKKDADGFHPTNTKQFLAGGRALWPVMTRVVMTLIEATGESLHKKRACIIANTPDVFAPPLVSAFADHDITSTAHRIDDGDLTNDLKRSDIVVVAVGRRHAIKPDMIKTGSIIVDIGINKTPDGITGDVDPAVDDIAAWRSPVPGGVGPVTVATLLQNVVQLANK